MTYEQAHEVLMALEYSKPFNSSEAKARHERAKNVIGRETARLLREKAERGSAAIRGEKTSDEIASNDATT